MMNAAGPRKGNISFVIYVKPTLGIVPNKKLQPRSIISFVLKVKSEGRRSLDASLLQRKQEPLKEGKKPSTNSI